MVVATDIGTLADVIFAIEGTAINGAYLNDIKTNYIIPTLEYFSQGSLEDREYVCDEVFHPSSSALYGIVVYHAADRLPSPCTDIYGPYSNPQRFLQMLDKLELVGGRGESHANVAEALATSLICFDDMQQRREPGVNPQKHCILICNSPPYLMPVQENQLYAGNTAEQLASLFNEKSVHLTILSPRKIPAMFKLYEKAGGDLSSIQTKNYAKDPRHLVLLKGFSLKERPVSPTTNHMGGNMSSPAPPMPPAPNPVVGPPTPNRYPIYQAPPQRQPQARWPPPRPQFGTPSGSALIDQLTRPPSIPAQFNNANPMGLQQVGQGQQVTPAQRLLIAAGGPGAQGIMGGGGGPGSVMIPGAPAQQAMMTAAGQPGQPSMMPTAGPQGPMMAPTGNPAQGIMAATGGPGQAMMLGGAGSNPQQGMMVIGPSGPIPGQIVPPQQPPQPSPQQPNPNILPQQVQQGLLAQQNTMMAPSPSQQPGMMGQTPPQAIAQPTTQQRGDRQTIWHGILEWIEKAKNPNEQQKTTRHVPCHVSVSAKEGDTEIKADSWPQKLIMQLMPKQLIGNIGGAYLKNSKSVLFHPASCEALDSLTKVMSSGFAGCVHFSPHHQTDLRVLILLYTAEKRAYLGFIPNDQTAFVDRLRKIIQQQKTSQAIMRQQGGGQGGGQPGASMVAQGQQQMAGLLQQPPIAQAQQQHPNIAALGGSGGGGLMGAAGALGSGMAQASGSMPPGMAQGPAGMNPQLQQQPDSNQQQANNSQSQNAAFNEVARQENLVKIQRLRQTLEAAQQQELQYKQLESTGSLHYDGTAGGMAPVDQANFYTTPAQEQQQRQDWNQPWSNKNPSNVNILQFMNQMKMQQIQDQTQLNQQQQSQLEEHKLRAQLQQMQQQQQGGQAQQQRMMRPAMPNNPGLRHLLQQPQYRLQIQPQMRPGGPMQPNQQQQAQQQQQFDEGSYDFLQ